MDESKQNETRNNEAAATINTYYSSKGINLTARVIYSSNVYSKKAFSAAWGKSSSYVLLGSEEQLNEADGGLRKGDWEHLPGIGEYDDPGSTYSPNRDFAKNERISFVNSDRMNARIDQFNGSIGRWERDNFSSTSERLAFITMHEAGHPLFTDHSMRFDRFGYGVGHVSGTILDAYPKREYAHDQEMLDRLLEVYGPTVKE